MTTGKKRRQLVTTDVADVVTSQPRRPCSDCPWARAALAGWLGPWNSHQWLALAHGGGSSECHALKPPGGGGSWACAGFAIYQANVCKRIDHPDGLTLPTDRKHVFASPMEFASHHGDEFDAVLMMNEGAAMVRAQMGLGDEEDD